MSPLLRTTLLLGGILLLAFVVRAIDLNGPSLFVDEFSEITLAKASPTAIIWANDSAPPLFPLVLKTWMQAWNSDASARWFSVACGLASILCVYAIGARLVNNATGLAAAFILALMPMHVYYSQFVRCYSLLFLLVALDLWLLLRAAQLNRARDLVVFALFAILGAYTHYYFVIFLATSVVLALITNPSLRRSWKPYAAYAAIALAMLPFIWLLPGDLEFQKGLRDPRPVNVATFGYTYFSPFNGYTLGPSSAELQTITSTQAIRAAAPWLAAVGIIVLILGYEGVRQLRINRSLLATATLTILPVAILGLLSIAGGLNYNVRFITWIMLAIAVLLGAGLAANWHRRHVQFAVAAFVLLSSVAFYNRHWVARYEHEDLRDAAAYIQANATAGDTIYVVSDYLSDLTRYYLGPRWHVVELPKPGDVNRIVQTEQDAQLAADTTSKTSAARRSWIIYSRSFHGDPHGLLLEKLKAHQLFEVGATLPGVTVYRTAPPQVAAK
jgi:phosphate/sulfate permease